MMASFDDRGRLFIAEASGREFGKSGAGKGAAQLRADAGGYR